MFTEAKYIVDPNYNPETEARLYIESEEIILENCKIRNACPFKLTIRNIGKKNLSIFDIVVSCDCLRLLTDIPNNTNIKPGEKIDLNVEFKPLEKGEIERQIIFTSNSIDPIKIIKVKANIN